MSTNVKNEYPRPQMQRENWLNLNGSWDFAYDDNNVGKKEQWYLEKSFEKKIKVPFTYKCEMSGINEKDKHDIVWYRRSFHKNELPKTDRLLLHFGAVDYLADVWVNGVHLVTHEGGHVPFSVEITDVLTEENEIVVRAEDYTHDLELPRGKQFWKDQSESIFYTGTIGIWQTVWLEPLQQSYIEKIYLTPDIDARTIELEYHVNSAKEELEMEVEIALGGITLVRDTVSVIEKRGKRLFYLNNHKNLEWSFQEKWLWAPEHPVLFDMTLRLKEENQTDVVTTYFGMRKVSVVDGKFMLNNHPYYQRLVLDQGYWEESLLTPPSDEALILDIELAKKMGFNGARKHQKIEEPRYLYHADKMGFLVWGETANAYVYSKKYVHRMVKEWLQAVDRDYNHPCIVAWTPLNESWGVEGIMNNKDQQAHAASLYYMTKSLDQTRLISSNDGWEHTKTDMLTIHDYEYRKEVLKQRYSTLSEILATKHTGRGMMAQGWQYHGEPILVTEFGGISYKKTDWEGWGYSSATSDEDYIQRYYDVVSALTESPLIQGFCYTQLTDVEQEINGLLTYDRKPKVDLETIRAITLGRYRSEE